MEKELGTLVTDGVNERVMTIIGKATYLNGQEMCMCQDGVITKETFNFLKGKWYHANTLHEEE